MFVNSVSLVTGVKDQIGVLKQVLPTWLRIPFREIIIVDWSSSPGEQDPVRLIKQLRDHRVRVLKVYDQKKLNQNASWNTGISYSTSPLVQCISCNNQIEPTFLDKFILDPENLYTHENFCLFGKDQWKKVRGFREDVFDHKEIYDRIWFKQHVPIEERVIPIEPFIEQKAIHEKHRMAFDFDDFDMNGSIGSELCG